MTAESLNSRTLKDLSRMARQRGVTGWHTMRKEQLVRALLKQKRATTARGKAPSIGRKAKLAARGRRRDKPGLAATRSKDRTPGRDAVRANGRSANGRSANGRSANGRGANGRSVNGHGVLAKANGVAKGNGAASNGAAAKPLTPRQAAKKQAAQQQLALVRAKTDMLKNLAARTPPGLPEGYAKDRLIAMVRDPYWLHAYWELTRQGVRRAEAAMGQEWHTARPVLRLLEVSNSGTTSSAERVVRDIEIHGGVNNWYVDVQDPPRSFRLEIGYLASGGRFFSLARSNIVATPRAGVSDALDENWSDVARNFDKIYAMSGGYSGNGASSDLQELFEERLRRPMGSPMTTQFGSGANSVPSRRRNFSFDVDAELIVFGSTEPDAHVTLQGDPVRLRPDGTFTVRFNLPNCRQVIPAVASSADGVEQRTIVLAVERNTKTMEPLLREGNE
jgi:hypothetical protein